MPGWPVEVPLPIDSGWKQDYSASIRRLIRDGVDVPLANLFVRATVAPAEDASRPVLPANRVPDGGGEDRARSASEAFMYRRLETLPETNGRFRLNVSLPIAFDNWSQMEVDLLCAEAKLVVELDGPQHLGDVDAYRRDRRKDALLQRNGYYVLRFLTEDAGKHLDTVLDTIIAALAHQRRHNHAPLL